MNIDDLFKKDYADELKFWNLAIKFVLIKLKYACMLALKNNKLLIIILFTMREIILFMMLISNVDFNFLKL